MAGGTRSRLGCWTCRLRRKKCDERRPACANCDSLEKRSGDVLEPSVVATMETIERKPDEEVESEVEKTGQEIN